MQNRWVRWVIHNNRPALSCSNAVIGTMSLRGRKHKISGMCFGEQFGAVACPRNHKGRRYPKDLAAFLCTRAVAGKAAGRQANAGWCTARQAVRKCFVRAKILHEAAASLTWVGKTGRASCREGVCQDV